MRNRPDQRRRPGAEGQSHGARHESNLKWGAYEIEELFKAWDVAHAGYFNDHVLNRPDRLVPVDAMRELVTEGKVGKLHDTFFSTSGNCTVTKRCEKLERR